MTRGGIAVNWGLWSMGFAAGEIERRRFLDRHHHLIQPRFYSVPDRLARDRAILVEGFVAAGARSSSGA